MRINAPDQLATAAHLDAFIAMVPTLPTTSVTWAAPADGGSPITGYILRTWDGLALTETPLAASATSADVPGGVIAAQLLAVNAVGSGTPAEVVL